MKQNKTQYVPRGTQTPTKESKMDYPDWLSSDWCNIIDFVPVDGFDPNIRKAFYDGQFLGFVFFDETGYDCMGYYATPLDADCALVEYSYSL